MVHFLFFHNYENIHQNMRQTITLENDFVESIFIHKLTYTKRSYFTRENSKTFYLLHNYLSEE